MDMPISHTEQEYAVSRKRYHKNTNNLVNYSVSINGTKSGHGRQYWSSILLSKMALSAMTINRLIPDPKRRNGQLWDLASLATLARGLCENYIMMRWLCFPIDDEQIWKFRIALMTVVDNRSRFRMAVEQEVVPEPEDFKVAQAGIAKSLFEMPLFQSLPDKRKKELLKGDKLPFIQDDVIQSLPIDRESFRRYYRYLSAFVHTGTVSFFRVAEHGRGNGEKNPYEVAAIGGIMDFCSMILEVSILDVIKIQTRIY